MGTCFHTLLGVLGHLGGGFDVLQELNMSNASPGIAQLQQGGSRGSGEACLSAKPVPSDPGL